MTVANSADDLYQIILDELLTSGKNNDSRNGMTIELIHRDFVLKNPRRRLVTFPKRLVNPGFRIYESLWILTGSNDIESIKWYNSHMDDYSDDHIILYGAYGDRLGLHQNNQSINQLTSIYHKLRMHPDDRQCVAVIFKPEDLISESKDIPCNILIHFMIRDEKLHAFVFCRSQDMWLGFPYDIYNFTLIQEILAGWLNIEVGEYYLHVASLHLYERNIDKAKEILSDRICEYQLFDARVSIDDYNHLMKLLVDLERHTRCNKGTFSLADLRDFCPEFWYLYAKSLAVFNLAYKYKDSNIYYKFQYELDGFDPCLNHWIVHYEKVPSH